MNVFEEMSECVVRGKAAEVRDLVQQALKDGTAADVVLNEGLLPGMNIIGVRFKNNEVYVPEVLIAARAMKAGTEILRPKLAEQGVEPAGVVVLGTVKGDLHDIGKNLVGMMLEGAGFGVVDVGIDVGPEKFVAAAIENSSFIIAISALLTTTMTNMKAVIEAVRESEIADKAKIMIGGAPVTQEFCDEIGADAYAPDAASAADVAKELVAPFRLG